MQHGLPHVVAARLPLPHVAPRLPRRMLSRAHSHSHAGSELPCMQASVLTAFGGPACVLPSAKHPVPGRPTGSKLLLRVRASSVNPIDCWMARGYGAQLFALTGAAPPLVLGRDVVGEVVARGPLAWGFALGDVVAAATHPTAPGAHAELALCAEAAAAALPAGVADAHAAAVGFAGLTAWRGLVAQAGVGAGDSVLVLGAGGAVGGAAVQLAASRGCTVSATCLPAQLERVCALGAAAVETSEQFAERVRCGEGGRLDYDVVLDGAADAELQGALARRLRPGARLLDLNGDGICAADRAGGGLASLAAGGLSLPLKRREMAELGVEYDCKHFFWPAQRARDLRLTLFFHAGVLFREDGAALAQLLGLVQSGELAPRLHDETYGLHEAGAAMATYEDGSADGKVVLCK